MPLFKFLRRGHGVPPDRAPSSYIVDSTDPGIQTSSETAILQPSASTSPTNPSQDSVGLRPTTDSLLEDSRFRVLVVGKSGVGKSSLINAVFRAKNLTRTSDDHATQHDIDQELTSDDNQRLILHDSQGFVGGDIGNLRTVQEFIKRRSAERELKDRLHAIWLCCEIPVSGGRVFERGDEILLQDNASKVPIIVVFTKYDQLVMRKKSVLARSLGTNLVEWERRAKETALEAVKSSCEKPLNTVAGNKHRWTEVSTTIEYRDTIEQLITLTMDSIIGVPTKAPDPKTQTATGEGATESEQPNLGGWLFAVAQRGSLRTKISTSIDVGRHKYWGYMFSGTFTGIRLDECLGVIHDDIVNVWNFNDPNHQCLKSTEFRALMTHLVTDLASERPNPPGLIDIAGKVMGPAVAMVGAVPPSAPFVLPAAIAVTLASWAYGIYQRTPEILRYLMGYIIDIIIVMSCLFALVDSRRLDRVSPAMVKSYVNDITLPGLRPKRAISRISELVDVEQYKELHAAVIAASRTLEDDETWITSDAI